MKLRLFIISFLILYPYFLFSQVVNVILTNGNVIKGNLLGKSESEIVIQSADGKTQSINKSEIKMVFDAVSGNQIDLNQGTAPAPPPTVQENPPVYNRRQPVFNGPTSAFGIDLLDLAFGSVRISYEKSLTDWFSLKAEAAYSPNYYWYSGISYWSAALYARFYFGRRFMWFYEPPQSLAGPFFELGAGVEGATISYSYRDYSGSYSINGNFPAAPMVRIEVGNKILLGRNSGVFIEPRFGVELSFGSWNSTYSGSGYYSQSYPNYFPYIQGFGEPFIYGIDFGYAF